MNILRKMQVTHSSPCEYHLKLGDELIAMNELIGRQIAIHYTGSIFCVQCGRATNKSFQQGHCFPCFRRLQECGCMVKPELCKFYEGGCDPDDWAHAQCFGEHVVYLANSSGLKVGITRACNVPSRWIDQGAIAALPFVTVSNRYQAGLVEVLCKEFVADKTNWRVMLKGTVEPVELQARRDQLLGQIDNGLTALQSEYPNEISVVDNECLSFNYPVTEYPTKISTYNLDKQALVEDTLEGIKGQYLIFSNGVINVRKFSGYEVELRV